MSEGSSTHGLGVIAATLVIALGLTAVPLPDWAAPARPEWVALVVIYWSLALPSRVGVGIAWTAGLFQDALIGTLLGQHALAFAVVAYLTVKLHQWLRLAPIWQQAGAVLGLLVAAQLVILWINGIIGRPTPELTAWLAVLIGAALWPWVFYVLRVTRRHFAIG